MCTAHDSVLIATKRGFSLHFATNEKQLRGSGRTSRGVKSIMLRDGDQIADMSVLVNGSGSPAAEGGGAARDPVLLAVTSDGFGKRVEAGAFGKKGRAGMGMIAIKFKQEGDTLARLTQAADDEQAPSWRRLPSLSSVELPR